MLPRPPPPQQQHPVARIPYTSRDAPALNQLLPENYGIQYTSRAFFRILPERMGLGIMEHADTMAAARRCLQKRWKKAKPRPEGREGRG